MAMMTERRIRHIPVIDDGEVVGMISIGDLVKFGVAATELRNQVPDRLHHCALNNTCQCYGASIRSDRRAERRSHHPEGGFLPGNARSKHEDMASESPVCLGGIAGIPARPPNCVATRGQSPIAVGGLAGLCGPRSGLLVAVDVTTRVKRFSPLSARTSIHSSVSRPRGMRSPAFQSCAASLASVTHCPCSFSSL